MDNNTRPEHPSSKPVSRETATELLRRLAVAGKVTEEQKRELILGVAREAWIALFTHFHLCELERYIDVTYEQDGNKYRLLFEPVGESPAKESEPEQESKEDEQWNLFRELYLECVDQDGIDLRKAVHRYTITRNP